MNLFFLFILFFSISLSNNINQGSLISSELLDSKTSEEIYDDLFPSLGMMTPTNGYDVDIYSIIYETLDNDGQSTLASGAVAVPSTSNFLPLLSYQHGTQLERNSVNSINGFDIPSMWLGTSGYITVLPDYLGFGISELFHPYMIYESSATPIIDMLRASKEFCSINNINVNNQLFLVGYSEGGYTTMATHKMIEELFSDEFVITASAPSAGPYDLSGTMADLMLSFDPYGEPFYLPFTILSYQDKYSLVESLNEYFLDYYAETLPGLFDGYHSIDEIHEVMPIIPIQIFKDEVIEEFTNNMQHPLRLRLSENNLFNWVPQANMKIFHSQQDELVPIENSEIAYTNFILNGAPRVDFEFGPFGTHQNAAPIILIGAATWFAEFKKEGIEGDLNQDNYINVNDITLLVSIVLGIDHIENEYFWLADMNNNEIIDIFDIIELVNYIID